MLQGHQTTLCIIVTHLLPTNCLPSSEAYERAHSLAGGRNRQVDQRDRKTPMGLQLLIQPVGSTNSDEQAYATQTDA